MTDFTELYDLRVTVERIEGLSVCGLQVGDYFELTDSSRITLPAGKHFCLYAMQAVMPLLPAKQRELAEGDWLAQDSLVLLPRSGRAPDHADRTDRADSAAHLRPDVSTERREVGLGLQTNKRPGEYAVLAQIAERGGFDVVTTFNDLWFQPALPALLEIAAATERVRVGPSCLNPFTVHPVELAGQTRRSTSPPAAARSSASRPARGSASSASSSGGRSQTIAEAWEIVSRLLAGDRSGFEGEVFRLAAGAGLAYAAERERVPLLVGSWSPRLTAFAAERAAELKIGGSANPAMVRIARERLGPGRSASSSER